MQRLCKNLSCVESRRVASQRRQILTRRDARIDQFSAFLSLRLTNQISAKKRHARSLAFPYLATNGSVWQESYDKLAGEVRKLRGNEIMCGEQFCQCGQDPSGSNRVTVELD